MKSVKTVLILFVVLSSVLALSSCDFLEHPFKGVWKSADSVTWLIIEDNQLQKAINYPNTKDLTAECLVSYNYDSKSQTADFSYRDGMIDYVDVQVNMRLTDLNTIEVSEIVNGKLAANYYMTRTDVQRGFTDLYEEEVCVTDDVKRLIDVPDYDFSQFSLTLYSDKSFEIAGYDEKSEKLIVLADGGLVYYEEGKRLTLNYVHKATLSPAIDFPSKFEVEDPGAHYVLRPEDGDQDFVFDYK